jgi:hypothetical protein
MDFGADVDDNDKHVYDFVEDRYNLEQLKLLDTEKVIAQLSYPRVSEPSIRKMVSGQ